MPQFNEPYDPRSFVEDHVFDAPGLLGWLTRRRKATLMTLVNVHLSEHAHATVLDIGCGYGDMLAEAKAAVKIGIDANIDAVRHAIHRAPGSRFALASVTNLPFTGNTFDAVICSEVLEHLERPGLLAAEIVRVTKPGGRYCITVPNETITTLGRFLLGKHPAKSPAHKQNFTPPTVAALFPTSPVALQLTPFPSLPFALSTNVVMLFTKA